MLDGASKRILEKGKVIELGAYLFWGKKYVAMYRDKFFYIYIEDGGLDDVISGAKQITREEAIKLVLEHLGTEGAKELKKFNIELTEDEIDEILGLK